MLLIFHELADRTVLKNEVKGRLFLLCVLCK